MPSIIKPYLTVLALLLFLAVLSLSGCGDNNNGYNYDSVSGKHPAGWFPEGHVPEALTHLDTCTECHGQDFAGGISKVACSQCHQGRLNQIHPLDWDNLVYFKHAGYVKQRTAAFCASAFCHGTGLQGVAGAGPSCSSCHIGGPFAVHPWASTQQDLASSPPLHAQYVFVHGGTTASCRNTVCHGANLQGVLLSGPPCAQCHFNKVFPP